MQQDFKPDPRKMAALRLEIRKTDKLLRRLYLAQQQPPKGKAA